MNKVIVKHSGTDAKDCLLNWNADFAKMILTLSVDFISPWLLVSFLEHLHLSDERFEKTKIIGAITITSRFATRIILPSGTEFRVRAYQPFSVFNASKMPAIELFEL